MKAAVAALLVLLAVFNFPAQADANIRQETVRFAPDKPTVTITGKIKGRQIVDYRLHAKGGQNVRIELISNKASTYFNLLPSKDDRALFIGSPSGHQFTGILPNTEDYRIRVYLMPNAARHNLSARFRLNINKSEINTASNSSPTMTATGVFDKTLEFQGIRFHVICANAASVNTLQIIPEGLEIDNSARVREINGTVTGAEVTDLNADGSPEIYVYVTSAGSGSYGSLVAYSVNRRKSLSEIYLAPVSENPVAAKGYRGHDAFAVLEGGLGHRFPIYLDTDINAKPSGGVRQLQYKLVPGEATWILNLDKILEF